VANHSGMRRGGWDWVRASLGCLSLFGLELEGLCGVAGLSSLWSGGGWTDETCKGSYCSLGVQGVCIEVSRHVRRMLLREDPRVTSRSRDQFGFRDGGIVLAGGGKGGIGTCYGYGGVCGEWVGACSR
jgi:hypothetical protein